MNPYGTQHPEPGWRRSSYCQNGECAEIAKQDGMISLRSSVAPTSIVRYTTAEWRALVKAIRDGEFSDLE